MGEIDCDSVGESPVVVRERMLKEYMGWRYEHPERYPHNEKWNELKAFGAIVPVSISVIEKCEHTSVDRRINAAPGGGTDEDHVCLDCGQTVFCKRGL